MNSEITLEPLLRGASNDLLEWQDQIRDGNGFFLIRTVIPIVTDNDRFSIQARTMVTALRVEDGCANVVPSSHRVIRTLASSLLMSIVTTI